MGEFKQVNLTDIYKNKLKVTIDQNSEACTVYEVSTEMYVDWAVFTEKSHPNTCAALKALMEAMEKDGKL